MFVTIGLHAAGTMGVFVARTLVLPLIVVPFQTYMTQVRTPEKPFDGRKGVIMVVVVEQA